MLATQPFFCVFIDGGFEKSATPIFQHQPAFVVRAGARVGCCPRDNGRLKLMLDFFNEIMRIKVL